MNDVNQRFKVYLNAKEISVNAFAKQIGITQSTLNSMLQRGTMPSAKLINAINAYTDLSVNWLLTGEGEMLKTPTTQINQTNNGTMAVGINNGTANIPQASPPGADDLYKMCLEMTREAKETHQMAVDVLKKASDMITVAYCVSDAIKVDRENVQSLFRDLRDARNRNVAENAQFLIEQKIAFKEWVEVQKKHVDAICAEFSEMIHAQTRETERNVNASTEKIVHASTKKIVETCKTMDISDIRKDLNTILIHYGMPRGAETTSGNG